MSAGLHVREVAVFGGVAVVQVAGRGEGGAAAHLAAAQAAAALRHIHAVLTRFDPGSPLSALNGDPRAEVVAGPLVRALARAVRDAGELTGGLVDGTILDELEAAGYDRDRPAAAPAPPAPPPRGVTEPPRPARPDPRRRWAAVEVDDERGVVRRPPGVRLDGGGLVKGLACDLLAARLRTHPLFAVDCGGDLRFGGTARRPREVRVEHPFDGSIAWSGVRAAGAVATSGTLRRRWGGSGGEAPAHHLIDPGAGVPAHTGLVQATAFAPTALEAEVRAKAALLAGPFDAATWLPSGGVLVAADGGVRVVEGAAVRRSAAA